MSGADTPGPVTVPACDACGHPWASHTRGGMCAGADGASECYCVMIRPASWSLVVRYDVSDLDDEAVDRIERCARTARPGTPVTVALEEVS